VWGAMQHIEKHPLGDSDVVVIVLPDSGTRYMSKVYNDEWMRTNGFMDEENSMEVEQVIRLRGGDTVKLITAGHNETLEEAIQLMNEHNISQLPVTNGQQIVGSLTENKILTLLTESPGMRSKLVGEVMDEAFPVVSNDLKIDQISRMLSDGVSAVIVRLDRDHYSIVTRSDLINAISQSSTS